MSVRMWFTVSEPRPALNAVDSAKRAAEQELERQGIQVVASGLSRGSREDEE